MCPFIVFLPLKRLYFIRRTHYLTNTPSTILLFPYIACNKYVAFQFLYEEVSIGYWIKFKEKQTPHVFCRDQKAYRKGVFFVNQTSSFVMTSPLIVLIKHF